MCVNCGVLSGGTNGGNGCAHVGHCMANEGKWVTLGVQLHPSGRVHAVEDSALHRRGAARGGQRQEKGC
jgi:hypothetical protein